MFLEYLATSSGLEKTLNKSAKANVEKFKAKQALKAPPPKYTLQVTKEAKEAKETPKATTPAPTVVEVKKDEPKADAEFTAEEDAKLTELKKDNKKSWKDIAAELNKVQHVCRTRWKEIQPKQNETTPATAAIVSAEANTKKARKGAKPAAAATDTATVDASIAGAAPQVIMEEDEDFTAEDLLVLSRIVHADYEVRWQRVASRFFDETGKRVHPMSIKEKVDGAD